MREDSQTNSKQYKNKTKEEGVVHSASISPPSFSLGNTHKTSSRDEATNELAVLGHHGLHRHLLPPLLTYLPRKTLRMDTLYVPPEGHDHFSFS